MKSTSKVFAARQIVHDIASWLTIIPLLTAFASHYISDNKNHDSVVTEPTITNAAIIKE